MIPHFPDEEPKSEIISHFHKGDIGVTGKAKEQNKDLQTLTDSAISGYTFFY